MQTTTTEAGPQTTMGELLQIYPGAQRALFRKYHIGGCSSCGFSQEETVEQLCRRNDDLSVDEVLDYVRANHEEDLQLQITPAALAEELKSSPPPRLVDIRTREEWEAARIEGAIFFNQEIMQEITATWPREQAFVLYDHEGKRSMDAAAYFAGHGFTEAKSLIGGIDAWSRDIDPGVPRYHLE